MNQQHGGLYMTNTIRASNTRKPYQSIVVALNADVPLPVLEKEYSNLYGTVLASSIYNEHGHIVVQSGTTFSPQILRRLNNMNVEYISLMRSGDYIDRQRHGGEVMHGIPLESDTYSQDSLREEVYKIFASSLTQKPYDRKSVNTVVGNVLAVSENILSIGDLMTGMASISHYDELTFRHCLDVMVGSMLLMKEIEAQGVDSFTPIEKIALPIGAFFHDFGKVQIHQKIIQKKGRLTSDEFNEIRDHPAHGVVMAKGIISESLQNLMPGLKENERKEIVSLVEQIIALHHRNMDGSGYGPYPKGITPENMTKLVHIVKILDATDAMTERLYSARKLPLDVKAELDRCSGTQFYPPYAEVAKDIIVSYPENYIVVLEDGSMGIVGGYDRQTQTYEMKIQGAFSRNAEHKIGHTITFEEKDVAVCSRTVEGIAQYVQSHVKDSEYLLSLTQDFHFRDYFMDSLSKIEEQQRHMASSMQKQYVGGLNQKKHVIESLSQGNNLRLPSCEKEQNPAPPTEASLSV
jgi:HD-GYP domain-containing protein (c-di-GMP phosphodiesterase class II)